MTKGKKELAQKTSRLEVLKVEYVPIESIKANDYNPNRQSKRDFDLLKRSIIEDGFTQPIIVHRDTMMIVDGEHRWRAARDPDVQKSKVLPPGEVPVVYVDMTPEQMRVSTLRHNRARGSEDIDLASQVLRDLRELGALDWAQESLLIDDRELSRLIDDVPVAQALAGEEYSEGWEPTQMTPEGELIGSANLDRRDVSPEADKLNTEIRNAFENAQTTQERAMLEQRLRKEIFRVNIQYTDEEAKLVREILEPHPATKLYELCLAVDATKETTDAAG